MKKIITSTAAVLLFTAVQGSAQVVTYFDPSVGRSWTNSDFTGSFSPDNPYVEAGLRFTFFGLSANAVTPFTISDLVADGPGMNSPFSYSPLSISGNGTNSTEYLLLDEAQETLNFAGSSGSFTLPGGAINRGAYFVFQLQYRDDAETQVNTSSSRFYVAGGPTWIGTIGTTNGTWSTRQNWAGTNAPITGPTVDFLFGGSLKTANTNDLAAGTDLRGIEFISGAGAFTMGGNSIDFFGGKIENNSVNTQTINFDFTFNGANQQVNPNTGNITLGGGGTINNNGFNMEVNGANTLTLDKTMTGAGGLTLEAGSRVNITENQTFTGDITVKNNAVLLLSQTDSISNDVDVSLSGGTIQRANGVSEVFGNLNLTTGSFLDFGTGSTTGTLAFGTYTPTFKLDVLNFLPGNVLTFNQDLRSSINNTSLFEFSNGFTSNWNEGTGTFTITAIPEPSTYVAAAGLLAMFLWSARRRLFKTAGAQVVAQGTGAA